MRLAGIEGCVVHEKEELKAALNAALANKEIGIILITEKLSFEFPEIINDIKLNRKLPLLVEIPDRHGSGRRAGRLAGRENLLFQLPCDEIKRRPASGAGGAAESAQ